MKLDGKKELIPVVYGDFPAKVINQITLLPDLMAFTLHWHDRIEILRVLSGSLVLHCADEQITVEKDEAAIISPRLLHGAFAGSGGVVYNVLMFDIGNLINSTSAAARFLKTINDGKTVFSPKAQSPELIACIDRITDAHKNTPKNHILDTLGDLYRLLGLIYTTCEPKENPQTPSGEKFEDIIKYINEHFCEAISSCDISRKFGYDEAYFCRRFKKTTGMTAMRYIQILRLEKARRMLLEGGSSIKDICLSCGFSDTAYFTNCFKRLYKTTPAKSCRMKNE